MKGKIAAGSIHLNAAEDVTGAGAKENYPAARVFN